MADGMMIGFGREILRLEASAVLRCAELLDERFDRALSLLTERPGKIVVTGVGKSGIAARKVAATLTSTGSPAVYLHPVEALHGDLGIVDPGDVVIALSSGGESDELIALLPALAFRNAPLIVLTGSSESTLARAATVVLDASVEREACPLNLAPTASVVVALALGDALAMALQQQMGFRPEDYAANHPAGALGRRLTMRVRDVLSWAGGKLPTVLPHATVMDVLCEISEHGCGATCAQGPTGPMLGLITDYDVRHALQRLGREALEASASDIMVARPAVVLDPEMLAYEALQILEDRPRPVNVAPAVDADGRCCGMVRVHDLVRARV